MIFVCLFFFFNDTATTEIYTLSLHDALPIYEHRGLGADQAGGVGQHQVGDPFGGVGPHQVGLGSAEGADLPARSEEHTSELQSRQYLVCRLLLEKKKKKLRSTILCYTTISVS